MKIDFWSFWEWPFYTGFTVVYNIEELPKLTECTFEPVSSKRYKLAWTPMEDSDQPAQPHSLISHQWVVKYCVDAQTDFNLQCTHMPNTYAEYGLGLYMHATSTNNFSSLLSIQTIWLVNEKKYYNGQIQQLFGLWKSFTLTLCVSEPIHVKKTTTSLTLLLVSSAENLCKQFGCRLDKMLGLNWHTEENPELIFRKRQSFFSFRGERQSKQIPL